MKENMIDRLNRIDRIVASADTTQTEFVVSVLQGIADRVYLLREAAAKFSKELFLYLFELNAFDFAGIPGPKSETDSEGKTSKWFYGWDAGFLLREAAQKNMEMKDAEINQVLIQLTDAYIDYVSQKKEDTDRNSRPDWFFCDIIEFLPLQDIKPDYMLFLREIGLKGQSYVAMDLTNRFFKRLVAGKNEDLLYVLLDMLYEPNKEKPGMLFGIKGYVESYTLREFADSSAEPLFVVLGTNVIDWLITKISSLVNTYPEAFLKFVIVSIDEDNQNRHSEDLNQLIIKQLRNCLEVPALGDGAIHHYVKLLIHCGIPVLERTAIYMINSHYSLLQEMFWQLDNPIVINEWKLEVFKLIKAHGPEFSEAQVKRIQEWIHALKVDKRDGESAEDENRYTAYRKLEWYAALETIDSSLRQLVEPETVKLLSITGAKPTHAGYDSWFEIRPGGDYSRRRLVDDPIKEIIDRVMDPSKWEGYDQWGLQEDFRNVVQARTTEVLKNLHLFKALPGSFLYYLVDGFRNIVNANADLDWTKLFDFVLEVFEQRGDFWDVEDHMAQDNSNTVGMIAWLIKDGVEKNVFTSTGFMEYCVRVLVVAEQKYVRPFVYLNENRDPNFDIINSTRGKIYDSMIRISMAAMLGKDKNQVSWIPDIKAVFDKRIKDGSFLDECYWTLGFYTPQVSYLDKAWWMENRGLIYINEKHIDNFAFKGYLLYAGRVYKDIYENLRPSYFQAVANYQDKSVYTDRLVEHSLIAWLHGLAQGEELLQAVLDKGNPSWLSHLVNYVDRRNIVIQHAELLTLWQKIIDALRKMEDPLAGKVLFSTADFVNTVDQLDDTVVGLFVTAVEHYSIDPMVHPLAESLTGFIDKEPERAGTMLQLLLDKTRGDFSYGDHKIVEGLRKLYVNGQTDIADKIALHLAEEGNYYVKNVYNEFHPVAG